MANATVTADTQTHESIRRRLLEIYSLVNEHNLDHLAGIFTEDVLFDDDGWLESEPLRGHAGVEKFFRGAWKAFPDFRFELVEGPYLLGDGRGVAVRVRISGTMLGPYDPPGFAPTGTRFSTEYGGFVELEGDRMKYVRIILNLNDVCIQLGAAPPYGSRVERLLVWAQRIQARRMRRAARLGRKQ